MPNYDDLKIIPDEPLTINDWNGLVDKVNVLDEYAHRIHLTPDGKVGIGNNVPKSSLSIVDSNKAQIEFKRDKASGAVEQNDKGGALRLQNLTNDTKIQLRTYGHSYFNGGNVGIGTDNPTQKLQITDGNLCLENTSRPANYRKLVLRETTIGQSPYRHGYKFSWREDDNSYRKNAIEMDESGDVYFQNKVGIGTNAPSERLEVKGSMKVTQKITTGSLTVNGVTTMKGNTTVNGNFTTTKKLIEFKRFKGVQIDGNPLSSTFGKYIKDTGKSITDWSAGVVGFTTGVTDVNEDGSRTFMKARMERKDNKWFIVCQFSSHNNAPNWEVDVMFVKKSISKYAGY